MRSRRDQGLLSGCLLEADPQDRAHAQATHGIGDPYRYDRSLFTILGAVVVGTRGSSGRPKLGQHCAAGVAAQGVLEVSDPARLGGV